MQAIEQLQSIMKSLRDPDNGCPWDIQQDFSSVAPYTVEEAYEVTDAIERNDMPDLKGELGDLLFQVIFHAQMADEQGFFDFNDVVQHVNEKLVRRHPHVFADEKIENTQQLEQRWEQHKQNERAEKENRVSGESETLKGIASTLPALRWSQKIQKRAASTGFDWPDLQPVFEKLEEELDELKAEIGRQNNQDRVLDEFGDVLFVCVNIAKHLGIDAEQALRHGNRKFISRFTTMEKLIVGEDKSFSDCSLEQMEVYWQKAKKLLTTENTEIKY